jgi:hypothetical protein
VLSEPLTQRRPSAGLQKSTLAEHGLENLEGAALFVCRKRPEQTDHVGNRFIRMIRCQRVRKEVPDRGLEGPRKRIQRLETRRPNATFDHADILLSQPDRLSEHRLCEAHAFPVNSDSASNGLLKAHSLSPRFAGQSQTPRAPGDERPKVSVG